MQARGDPLEQPVERGPGRHRDHVRPVPPGQDLPGPPQVEAGRPGRPACLLADRLLQRLHHTLVGAAPGRPGPAGTPVHQPGQAAGLIPLPLTFHRPGSDLLTRRGQLGRLRLLTLRQRADRRVIPGPGRRPRRRIRENPGENLDDVPFPPQGIPGRLLGNPAQRGRRQRRPHPARAADDLETLTGQQVSKLHHAGRSVLPGQAHQGARQPDHSLGRPVEAHPGTYPQDPRPRRAHRPAPSCFTLTRLPGPSRPAVTSADQHPLPQQVIQHRQDRHRIAGLAGPAHQRLRLREHPGQHPGDIAAVTPPVPVAGQPPHVRRQHRARPGRPPEQPAHLTAGTPSRGERLRITRLDPVIRADVDHHPRPIGQPGEVIRGVPPLPAVLRPGQPERLRRERDHRRVEVQHHRHVALQPRLEPDMGIHRGRVIQAGKAHLPAERRERPHRGHPLERRAPQLTKPPAAAAAIAAGELDLEGGNHRTHGSRRPGHNRTLYADQA